MQNPPCVPILFVFVVHRLVQKVFCCGQVQTKLIIDWHNYGYTIMQANKVNSFSCYCAMLYEKALGKFADQNFTVSKAFKKDLNEKFGLANESISVLYDRAVKGKFKTLNLQEKHELFERTGYGDVFTLRNEDYGGLSYVQDRPLLVVTSTSYTPDEDIGLLI
jgi:beta-1,4-mannosyltransferase